MENSAIRLTVLGTRGSIPVSGADYAEFGGSTSCYMLQAGMQTVLLDAGSGLLSAPTSFDCPPTILLSHWHLDHVMGLGMYGRLGQAGAKTYLYAPAQSDEEAAQRLAGLFAPPYWPLELTAYPGDLCVRAMPGALRLGPLQVEAMEGNHPGGSLVYRLSHANKTVVYATDYEHEQASFARLAVFAQGVDLLLYDAQYSDDEYEGYRGFGHSTAQKGMELMAACHAKQLLLIHHDPRSANNTLHEREALLHANNVHYAREGEVILL